MLSGEYKGFFLLNSLSAGSTRIGKQYFH